VSRRNAALLVGGAGAVGAMFVLNRRAQAARAEAAYPLPLSFGRPVPASTLAIVSSGWSSWRDERVHRALDIPIPVGTPVLAIDRGIVVRVERDDVGDAGRWVGVLHPSGVTSRYLHLSRVAVRPGQRIERGDALGASGDTGNSAAPHLHLDLRAPDYLIDMIEARLGKPPGGWGPNLEPYGRSIPGEPWIPVDGYRPKVTFAAVHAGIPLFRYWRSRRG
jgi:murein DD-endopeptidase MepM/ murein hydrolase activator NlpD